MYSGTTLTPISGRLLGAHQKIDRVARADLLELLNDDALFPDIREILRFEGTNGPDGIKRKSPAKDEPWHYIDPFNEKDVTIVKSIESHYLELVKALKEKNRERSAFESAWLAHAIVDGLTPAHHYPYEAQLAELRGGEGKETRTTIKEKIVMPGDTRKEQAINNWKMWGPHGLMSTHGMFEFGIATLIAPMPLKKAMPTEAQIAQMRELGITEWFQRSAREVGAMGIYERYYKHGWTVGLARQIRLKLVPVIIATVTLAWYSAAVDAGLVTHKPKKKKKPTA